VRDSTTEPGTERLVEHIVHTSGVLGIKEDLSTSSLLLHAKQIGMRTSASVADVVRQQAVVDSKSMQSTLQQVCNLCSHAFVVGPTTPLVVINDAMYH
jgi:hypothetical protein